MEEPSGTPDTVIIGQDEDSEIRVQPVTQSGSRHLDIRVWRRGPTGFAPTRDALTLDTSDLEALRQGIDELLEASEQGRQVARIVLDTGEGRRLRAETAPFGTRYVARLGFWQRARSTWRPDGDGITLAAERLPDLNDIVPEFRSWVGRTPEEDTTSAVEIHPTIPEPWPNPGADWITLEADRVAFHPKGVRLTCSVVEEEDHHWLRVLQWRREDSIWTPEPVGLDLTVVDLDALLTSLRGILMQEETEAIAEEVTCADGSTLLIRVDSTGRDAMLHIEHRPSPDDRFEPRIALPAGYLPRFGRALVQGWSLLAGWLSDSERTQLQSAGRPEVTSEQPAEVGAHRSPTVSEQVGMPAERPMSLPEPQPAVLPPPRAIGPAVRFGEESETPGAVIPQEGQVRVVVEGYLMPRGLTLPADVVGRVVTGLEELYAVQLERQRVDPTLMCDRPDCAVYGRVGTTIRPDGVELRVWTSPRDSDSITFDRQYLPELIEGLRQSLRLLAQPEPLPAAAFVEARARVERQQAPAASVTEEMPAVRAEPVPAPVSLEVGKIQVGERVVRLELEGAEQRSLILRWDGQTLEVPTDHLEELLSEIRALYYDALRGHRGRTLTVGQSPVAISIRNQGAQIYLELRDEARSSRLSVPAGEIPSFLNAARAALSQTQGVEEEESHARRHPD